MEKQIGPVKCSVKCSCVELVKMVTLVSDNGLNRSVTDYAFVRQMSVLFSHKKNADYLQIRLLKSTYLINNAAVIHMFERVLSVHYCKEFSSTSVKYFITLHTKSFTANHVI